ncbi:amino acid adenylation domain-containing protein [Pseudoalteromonas sp. MMG006]|uniref:non-ribosomal peptide synthetase n=1 Tax=Pseudoalteromonas sp. MMG006 TaxID=2822683 RepID=UPI001B3732B6|nr:non-ribosomal peptide synthetase [Pseudoalteromonas sp. MMG006]MBQ4800953.1 amino acid adenylation domain-containing protein [Pseudoalteromonas sp. MMG006]
MSVSDNEQNLFLTWSYSLDLFSFTSIENISKSFEHLLVSIINSSDTLVANLSLVAEDAQSSLLVEDNVNQQYPYHNIHQWISAQANDVPDNIAVRFNEDELSYGQLEQLSNQFSHYLMKREVKPGDLVALDLPRGSELIIALLAVLKAGAAYLPLEPTLPESRKTALVNDAGCRCVINIGNGHYFDSKVLQFNAEKLLNNNGLQSFPNSVPEVNLVGSDLAYVIYTSGSTGKPKGIKVSHKALVEYCYWTGSSFMPKSIQASMLVSSIGFDGTIPTVFLPLLTGKTIDVCGQEMNIEEFWFALMGKDYPCMVKVTPSYALALWAEDLVCPEKHIIVFGGELLTTEVLKRVKKAFPNATIYNHYGPSEAVVGCIYSEVTHISDSDVIPIGDPIENVKAYILDEHLQPSPVGAIGELYIGGSGLADGYLNLPELTKECFVRDPFSADSNSVMYKSGDLVKKLPSGKIVYIGRIDKQINFRGYRIEPAEIEKRIEKLERVEQSVVCLKESKQQQRLVAYLVLNEPNNALHSELVKEARTIIQQGLPSYMMPEFFLCIDELPLTVNDKVDYAALPEPSAIETRAAQPMSQNEHKLWLIWHELLQVEQLPVDADLFKLGAHSLLALTAVNRIREEFNISCQLRLIFEHPTIAGQAEVIAQVDKEHVTTTIVRADREQPLLLSYAQQRLWLVERMRGPSAQNNMPGALRLKGSLDYSALESAFNSLVLRHEVLRTHFVEQGGEIVQLISDSSELIVEQHQITETEQSDIESALRKHTNEFANRIFDLRKDCLIRVKLIQVDAKDNLLLLSLHHIVTDGWSMQILVEEFAEFYRASCLGSTAELPELELQYADYAVWQRKHMHDDNLSLQLQYWKQQLAGLPDCHSIPLDQPRKAGALSATKGEVFASLDAELAQSVRELAQGQGVTVFMFIHSVLSILLSKLSHQSDIVIGSSTAGRSQKQLEPIVGFFVNNLVLRTQLEDNLSFVELLSRNKKVVLDAFDNQYVPFDSLVEELKPTRTLDYNPLFQIMLNVQSRDQRELTLTGLELQPYSVEGDNIKFDLVLNATESPLGISLNWSFNRVILKQETISLFNQCFMSLLAQVVENPNCIIGEYSVTQNVRLYNSIECEDIQENEVETEW